MFEIVRIMAISLNIVAVIVCGVFSVYCMRSREYGFAILTVVLMFANIFLGTINIIAMKGGL